MHNTALSGGYVGLTTATVWNLTNFAAAKELSLAGLKIYLACCEMLERRCQIQKSPCYGGGEIKKLTGLGDRAVSEGLRELKRLSLLEFSEGAIKLHKQATFDFEQKPFGTNPNRIIPLPRRIIKALCAHTSKSQIVIALIHFTRGLFKLGKKFVTQGAVKASWITDVFGFGKTVIHSTRAWLRSLGFMKDREGVEWWRRNKFGYYFEILLGSYPQRKKRSTPRHALSGGAYKRNPFLNKKIITSTKRTRQDKAPVAGSFVRRFSKMDGPDLRDVETEDLKRISTLLILFKQAVAKGLVANTTVAFQNFVGAAVRSLNRAKNPPAFFITLVKTQDYWKHITHAEEERALRAIRRYKAKQWKRAGVSGGFHSRGLFLSGRL